MRRIFLLSPLLLLLSCSNESSIKHIDGTTIGEKELQTEILRLMDAAHVTGLAVTIFNDNKPVFKKAFGYANFDKKDTLRTDQVFYGASLSKAVFGYLSAILVKEGVIDLDKPLQQYLDTLIPDLHFEKEWRGFKDIADDKRYEKITARMCLSHSTGFPNWRWISRIGDFDPEGKLQIYFDPGTRYSYSGEGLMLLQYVIEHITGKGLEQLARDKVFDPLGMDHTSYLWMPFFDSTYCNGHNAEQKVIPKDKNDEAVAAGSMETTPDDYAKFVSHVLELSSDGSEITKLMFHPNIRIHSKTQFGPGSLEDSDANDGIGLSYGLAWGLLKSPYGFAAFKEGHDDGFQHYSIIYREKKIGVVLMSNSDNSETIFKYLLELTIGDHYTPWQWERYIPYDSN